MIIPRVDRITHFSPDRVYRYALWREWDMFNPTYLQVIGLNPSTADEVIDDNTVRFCMGLGKRLGYGALCMTNLFALRSTDPSAIVIHDAPVGPDNDVHLRTIAQSAAGVLVAWGNYGRHHGRAGKVLAMLQDIPLWCLGLNKDGSPKHPLYQRKDVVPIPYSPHLALVASTPPQSHAVSPLPCQPDT